MIANPGKSMNVLGQIKVARMENDNTATGRVRISNLPISDWNGRIIGPINILNAAETPSPSKTGNYTESTSSK